MARAGLKLSVAVGLAALGTGCIPLTTLRGPPDSIATKRFLVGGAIPFRSDTITTSLEIEGEPSQVASLPVRPIARANLEIGPSWFGDPDRQKGTLDTRVGVRSGVQLGNGYLGIEVSGMPYLIALPHVGGLGGLASGALEASYRLGPVVLFASGEGAGSIFLGFFSARAVQLQGTLGLATSFGPVDLVLQGGQRVLWGSARSQDPYRDRPDQNASLNQAHAFAGLLVGVHFDASGRPGATGSPEPIETSPRAR